MPLLSRAAELPGTLNGADAAGFRATARDREAWRLDASLVGAVIVLSLLSLVAWLGPRLPDVADARALDITINVAAVLVGGAVAILAWVRNRDTGEPAALYVCSAFVALTVINGLLILFVLAGREGDFGLAPARPGDAPVYL